MQTRLLLPSDMLTTGIVGTDWVKQTCGERVRMNPRGFMSAWVVVCDDEGKPLYMQPKFIESEGYVVVLRKGDKYGLVSEERSISKRVAFEPTSSDDKRSYVQRLIDDNRLEEAVTGKCVQVLGLPRGIPNGLGVGDVNDETLAIKGVRQEVLEEAGCTIENVQRLGETNWNTTFAQHCQLVYFAEVVEEGEAHPEPEESIGPIKFYAVGELQKLAATNQLFDAMTVDALSRAGVPVRAERL